MPDSCVVSGCGNTKDKNLGISIHRIPFHGDSNPEARKRRKTWTDFVCATKKKKLTDSKYSVICSEHFVPEDFERRFDAVSGMEIPFSIRISASDYIGVTAFPTVREPKKRSSVKVFSESTSSIQVVMLVLLIIFVYDNKKD